MSKGEDWLADADEPLPVLSEEDLDDFDQLESNEESGDKGY